MEFGLVRETTPQERRVPLTPEGARGLVAAGHGVLVENGAGLGSGFNDTDYLAAGAQVVYGSREVAARADILLKVHAPLATELELVREGATIVGFLHLASAPAALHQQLIAQKATTLSCELVREDPDEYPILEPLSALGGRVAVTLAAFHLTSTGHGPGLLLGGSSGVPPCLVLVIGGGTAGQAAAAEAAALGAQVVVLDRDPRRLQRLERAIGRMVVTATASEFHLSRYLEQADVVIGAVAVRGEPAPKVLRRQHVRLMKEGCLFIDMSIDEGGCSETSRPTTPESPSYEVEGVRHICIPNLPSEVARTASRALGNSLLPYLFELSRGVDAALARSDALRQSCSYHAGRLVSRSLQRYAAAPLQDLDVLVPREA
ncbi:MAG: NAD(P)-binding domain-containing protein [Pseudomonadota bacterium]|nr:NAD(P)-binding domain-containing protein [Pseudomonadota bacterium]